MLVIKNQPANAGDVRDASLIPGSGRSPGGGHGNPLQYSCLENPKDRGAWWATTVHGVAKTQTRLKRLSTLSCWSEMNVAQLCPTLCDSTDCPWNFPGQNAGVGSLSLLQGIFPTQGSNPGLPHCRWILYQLSQRGSPLSCWMIPKRKGWGVQDPHQKVNISPLIPLLVYLFCNIYWVFVLPCAKDRCVHAKSLQSCLILCNLRNVTYQAPLSMGFSRHKY